jgi:hypothetical protein
MFQRWLALPYTDAPWESYLIYGSSTLATLIALLNILLVVFFKSKKYRLYLLRVLAGLLFLLLFFPIVMGMLNAYGGAHIWVDVLALLVLYGCSYWLYQVYERLRISYKNDNL